MTTTAPRGNSVSAGSVSLEGLRPERQASCRRERALTAHHFFIKEDTEGEHVGTGIDGLSFGLLRRHILRIARHRGRHVPVTGVSWHEASAHAAFAGKSLPSVHEWMRASGIGVNSSILQLSNFNGKAVARVGMFRDGSVRNIR